MIPGPGLSLHAYGDRECFVRDGRGSSYAAVAARSDALLQTMQAHNVRRALVQSDDPAEVIRAIDACARLGADLYVAHTSLPPEAISELIERFSIQLRIGDVQQLHAHPSGATALELPDIFLMTSGSSGVPKIARHSLYALIDRLRSYTKHRSHDGCSWLLTYQPTGFAGIQVLLTAMLTGAKVVSTSLRTPHGFYEALRRTQISHVSATATFWRSLLMLLAPGELSLQQITIGGESIDQHTLDRLAAAFPQARISHTYASTEAGFVYSVSDRREGFPKQWLEDSTRAIQLRIRDGLLQVKTSHAMLGYASGHAQPLLEDGWLATLDRCELHEDRVRVVGRNDSIVNVAGSKICPSAVERFLLALPGVAEARVYGVPNPITGAILGADVVLMNDVDGQLTSRSIMSSCRAGLAPYAVPRILRIVDAVAVAASGKKG